MTNPLPNFVSSLSKYIRVEDHYRVLASIKHDVREGELRKRFGDTLIATAKQRYLVTTGGRVIRDKLIDLIHEEGHLTSKVKMVMYFLFMFRDRRYRDFICRVVGKDDGRWNPSVFRTAQHSSYFAGAGGHKAFTNLRQFLLQIGILDEQEYTAHLAKLNSWFPLAVEVAAQSIEDRTARQDFLASPHGFLIRYRINALLNTTPDELAKLEMGGTYEETENSLPLIELDEGVATLPGSDFRPWNRLPPARRNDSDKYQTITDPVKLERANYQHYLLERLIVAICQKQKAVCHTNRHIDLLAKFGAATLICEMKSCTAAAVRPQLRRAVSQLLEYRYLYRHKLAKDVRLCAVIERQPRKSTQWLVGYLTELKIGLIWKNDEKDKLNCSPFTKELLGAVMPQVKRSDF